MNTAWIPINSFNCELPVSCVVFGYLLGSIPVAWLLARLVTGQDLRELGSGNVGVMNTALSVTRWAGLLVFLSEAAKGMLAVATSAALAPPEIKELAVGLTVVAAVVGTRFPVWLDFKGGRGNTTGIAALLLISWPALVAFLAIWALARTLARSSFIATRVTLALMPVVVGVTTQSWWYALTGLALCLIYIGAQERKTDDHLIMKERWPSFWGFLTSPPRRD